MPVAWSDKDMNIGVGEIDADHKKLIGLINMVEEVALNRASLQALEHVLNQLVLYVNQHFTREEALMRRAEFPQLAAHEELHAQFSERVCKLTAEFFVGATPAAAKEILGFLSDWLLNHIQNRDREFIPYLNRLGM